MKLFPIIQKAKWDILGRINPLYYIWSQPQITEQSFKKSGEQDANAFLLSDRDVMTRIDPRRSTLLSIGGGAGRITEFLAPHFQKVILSDISAPMVELAKKRLQRLDNIIYQVTDGYHLPFPDRSVDCVFSYIVFQHFSSKKMVRKNLEEIHRVLRDGGVAKIQFRGRPAHGGLFRMLKWYYGVYFTPLDLEKLLVRLGFTVLRVDGAGEKSLWILFQK